MADDAVQALVLDLLEWLGDGPRPYDEVLERWRTSCPRLSVWEDAHADGLVQVQPARGGATVVATSAGRALLARSRPLVAR